MSRKGGDAMDIREQQSPVSGREGGPWGRKEDTLPWRFSSFLPASPGMTS